MQNTNNKQKKYGLTDVINKTVKQTFTVSRIKKDDNGNKLFTVDKETGKKIYKYYYNTKVTCEIELDITLEQMIKLVLKPARIAIQKVRDKCTTEQEIKAIINGKIFKASELFDFDRKQQDKVTKVKKEFKTATPEELLQMQKEIENILTQMQQNK